MLHTPNLDAVAWLESDEGMRYFRNRGATVQRAMFALIDDRTSLLNSASTSDNDLDNFRLDLFWNVA